MIMLRTEMRRFDRYKGRLACVCREGEKAHRAFVTNLAAGGLFLQTRARLQPGSQLVLEIERDDKPPLQLTGTVARKQTSHPSAIAVTQPGVGFAIETAPEEYFDLVMKLLKSS